MVREIDLGGAVFYLTGDDSQYNQVMKKAENTADDLGRKFESIDSKLTFTQLSVSASVAVDGVSRLAGGMGDLFNRMDDVILNMAYIRGESLTIDSIFESASETIYKFGETSAQAVGLSAREFNNLVAPIGNILTNLTELNDADVAQWSIDLAQRAADLAFAFNTTVPEATSALEAALRGELEPARALGISFTAATVEAKALELGLAATKGELTEGDKVLARYNLVMEQSGRFAGLFADNTNNAFVQLATFKAEQKNTAGELGAGLLPIYTKMLELFNSTPHSVQLATFAFTQFAPPLFDMASGLGLAVVGISGLVSAIPRISAALGALATTIGTTNLVLGGLLVALGAAALAYQLFVKGGDSAADSAARQAEAQKLLEENTIDQIQTQRDYIKAQLDAADATGKTSKELLIAELHQGKNSEADKERRKSIEDLQVQLGIYDTALGTIDEGLQKNARSSDGVISANEQLAGAIDTGTVPALGSMDEKLGFVNESLSTMTGRSKDAFDALDKFRNVPTQESLDLDAALAGVNARLADAQLALSLSKQANDGNAEAIQGQIDVLTTEKDVLSNSKDALYANRDATIATGEAKYGASGQIDGMVQSEGELIPVIESASGVISGQTLAVEGLTGSFVPLPESAANATREAEFAISNSGIPAAATSLSGSIGSIGTSFWNLGPDAVSALGDLSAKILGARQQLSNAAANIAANIGATFRAVLGMSSPSKVMQAIGANIIDGLVLGIEGGTHTVAQLVTYLGFTITDSLSEAIDSGSVAVQASIMSITDMITAWGAGVVSQMTETFKQAVGIAQAIAAQSALGAAAQPVLGAVAAASTALTTYVSTFIPPVPSYSGAVTQQDKDYIDYLNSVQGFAHGTSYVPEDMLAFLHKGEAVIPSSENNQGVNIHVAGSILSERELVGLVRSALRSGKLDLRGLV